MSGAAMDYDFGPKRNWRRWVWNRLTNRIADRRDATVLYLPGENDFDRPVAISKGFSEENLIGIERDPLVCRNLRAKGVLCVNGDFFETLGVVAISGSLKPTIVYGDLCCGLLGKHAGAIANFLTYPKFYGSTFVLNFMRGRESDDLHKKARSTAAFFPGCPVNLEKHRGAMFIVSLSWYLSHEVPSFAYAYEECASRGESETNFVARMIDLWRPEFFSYASTSGQVFDSIAFTNWIEAEEGEHVDFGVPKLSSLIAAAECGPQKDRAEGRRLRRISRSIAAVMAHRTMRQNAYGLRAA